jgi:hypothetical protein
MAKDRQKSNREAKKPKKTAAERSRGAAAPTMQSQPSSAASKDRPRKGGGA